MSDLTGPALRLLASPALVASIDERVPNPILLWRILSFISEDGVITDAIKILDTTPKTRIAATKVAPDWLHLIERC
jgi:hypothetical protein